MTPAYAWVPPLIIISALVIVGAAEWRWPDRDAARGQGTRAGWTHAQWMQSRWLVNFGVGAVNALLVRLTGAAGPAAVAILAGAMGFGLFNQVDAPLWLVIGLAIIVMDGAIYWQHRALHRWHWGWQLHRWHHGDAAMDISTAVRFNPGEALASMLYKSVLTLLLGLPLAAVIAFELWLAVGSIIEHANIRLPARADAAIRRFWVTPAMHRVHHSAHGDDHNHNYGFALSIWDQLFGSSRAAPSGQEIGLPLRPNAG